MIMWMLLSTIIAQPLANEDVLEPSVYNEVVQAISRAPTNTPETITLPIATNGLNNTQIAIGMVSSQKADGCWYVGTNNVTAAALNVLNKLIGDKQ